MNPAMFGVYIFGGMLAATPGIVDWSSAWIWGKLTLVAALTVAHHVFALWRKDFAADRNRRPARFYRIMNEVPTAIMIGIVFLVVVKP
jgi:putative membrane protein